MVVGEDRLFSAAHYAVASVEQTAPWLAVFSGLPWPQVPGVAHAMLAERFPRASQSCACCARGLHLGVAGPGQCHERRSGQMDSSSYAVA